MHLAGDQDGGVGQEVEARLDREEHQERELVQPIEVVGDDHVVAGARNVAQPFHLETETETHERDGDHPHDSIRHVGLRAYGEQVGGWERRLGHRG